MSKGSLARRIRRKTMRENKATFKDRLNDAIRTGQPVRGITFNGQNTDTRVKAQQG